MNLLCRSAFGALFFLCAVGGALAQSAGTNTVLPPGANTGTCTGSNCGTNSDAAPANTVGSCTSVAGGPPCGTNTSGVYVGPGDVVPGALFYAGLRGYNAASVGNKAINIVRASDTHACDVLISQTGGLGNTASCGTGADNGQSAKAFCNATTCTIAEAYDQTGNSNHFIQATGANQPGLSFNCINTVLPCMTFNGTTQVLEDAGFSYSGSYSEATNEKNTNNGSAQVMLGQANYCLCRDIAASSNTFAMFSHGAATNTAASSDAALHNEVGVYTNTVTTTDGYVDGTHVTFANNGIAGGAVLTAMWIGGQDNVATNIYKGDIQEVMLWGSVLTSAQAIGICHNQFLYWGGAAAC